MNYDAVLLTSFGGPENPDEVMPFLQRVTAGRGIPPERLEEVSHHYFALGGVSPINEQNRELLAHLREELKFRKIDVPIYLGNRNSEPYFVDALQEIYSEGHRKVLSLITSAYSSYSGCRQYRENLAKALIDADFADQMTIDRVRQYFDHPGFIQPFANGISQALQTLRREGFENSNIHVFFTTHSIPVSMAQSSGPDSLHGSFDNGVYVAQHLAAAQAIIEIVNREDAKSFPGWSLAYQSRSGPPQMPWLEPDIGDALHQSALLKTKAAIVVPIGFVSDHIEVIWDLDNEAAAIAERDGLRFIRVATPGRSKEFVAGLVDLLEERLTDLPRKALSPLGPWADSCPTSCCPNPRHELPTIATLIP